MDPATGALVLTAASAAIKAGSTIAAGNAARGEADFQARQMNQQAGQERATAQRQALIERRKTALALSRSQAVAAASGGGASDPSVVNLEGDIAGMGEYNALSALFSGEERARGLETGASVKQYEGNQAARSSKVSAAGKILGAAANTMMAKYGFDGPPGADVSSDGLEVGKLYGSDMSQYGPYQLPWLK